jgi:hypothetical protein
MQDNSFIKIGLLTSCILIGVGVVLSKSNKSIRNNPRAKSKKGSLPKPIMTPELIEIDKNERLLADANKQILSDKERILERERQAIGKLRSKRQYIKRKDFAYKTLAHLQGKTDLTPPKRKYKSQRVPRTFRVPYEIGGHTFYSYYKL